MGLAEAVRWATDSMHSARIVAIAPPFPRGPMAIRIVRLGEPRAPGEGVRFGTVRRPPRGVPKTEFARGLAALLRSPNALPTAVVLQEILGPPKARGG